jgi:hypothetical protein
VSALGANLYAVVMDIRTKLIFALVSVALGSMFVLGLFAVDATTRIVRESSAQQLEALAESKQRDLEKVIAGWEDRIRLVASRTQMRETLRAVSGNPDAAELARLERILRDALGSVGDLRRITLYDTTGRPVASQGASRIPISAHLVVPEAVSLGETLAANGAVEVAVRAPLRIDGELVGALEVAQGVDEIEHVTGDYTGLEQTGETYVVTRAGEGRVLFLNPLRHDGATREHRRLGSERVEPHVEAALGGREAVFLGDTRDYRGELVWAATRTLPETGWGLVVKIDASEVHQESDALRHMLRDLSLSLAAFAIVGGTLLGLYLARPIRELAEVVGRIRDGEVDLRADPRGEDEVGFLGRAINELLDDRKRDTALPPREDLD